MNQRAIAGDSLARDLDRHYRKLNRQAAEQELVDSIEVHVDEINILLQAVNFENMIKIRQEAQEIIDDCNIWFKERERGG